MLKTLLACIGGAIVLRLAIRGLIAIRDENLAVAELLADRTSDE